MSRTLAGWPATGQRPLRRDVDARWRRQMMLEVLAETYAARAARCRR